MLYERSGLLGHPVSYSAYCASKSAVDGITKALGCELGASGITVNALGPTVFCSPLTAAFSTGIVLPSFEKHFLSRGFISLRPGGN